MANLNLVRKGEPAGIPVRPAVAEYLAATRRQRSAGSQRNCAWHLSSFADFADSRGISLEQIDARTVDAFLDHFEQTRRPRKPGATSIAKSTLVNLVCSIKTFLAWCSRDRAVYADFFEESTAREIRRPKMPYVIIETFSQQQIRALLLACDDEENARTRAKASAIIHTLVGTGIRAQECCNLKLSDVHLEDGEASIKIVQGKGSRDRRIPLGPITRRKLAHWIETWRADQPRSAPLFTNRHGVEGLSVPGLQQLMERLGTRAKIEGVRCSPHSLRHTFACECIKRGMSVYNVSKLLGHASVVMTERYLRSLGADFDEMADQVAGQLR